MRASRRPSRMGLLAVLLAIACSGHQPTTHYYVLDPADGAAASSTGARFDIGVLPFVVDPPFDQDRIVYRVGEASPEIGFYDYHRWAAPLARMMPTIVSTAFAGIGGLASIEPAVPGQDHAYSLHGRLRSLVEIDLPQGQRVEARLELSLRDPSGQEIWSAAPASEAIVDTDSVERIVVEMRSALQAALAQAYPSLYTRIVLLHEQD